MRLFLFVSLTAAFFFCQAQAQNRCMDLFVKWQEPSLSKTTFHNSEVRQLFQNGVNSKTLEQATNELVKNGTLDIPVGEGGFVAAANVGQHHGGYGRYLWFRDFARVQQGLSQLPELLGHFKNAQGLLKSADAAKVRAAQLELLSDPKWTELAAKNIEDVSLHIDPANGFRSVIWIRRLLDPFLEKRQASKEEVEQESRWGHKQNDALAVFANSFFDILQRNEMRASEIPENARVNMMLLAAYFVKLKFWKMWDVGAWEEGMGQRTSSIAMVTSFLERYKEGLTGAPVRGSKVTELDIFFLQLREEGPRLLEKTLSASAFSQTQKYLETERVSAAIDNAYALIEKRLLDPQAPVIEAKTSNPAETRFEDTALIHIFWHPLKRMTASASEFVLKRLSVLERESGYIRYAQDWFLYGSAQVALHWHALQRFGDLAISDGQGGYRKATHDDIQNITEAYAVKNMERVIELSGKDLEAQWTLPDSYLVQFYADAYMRTKKPEYLDRAKIYFLRVSGLITGKGEFNSEGQAVEAWRLPEAYVPARFIKPDGSTTTIYLVSPNSPLNWSIAEYIMALNKMRQAVALDEAL